jgi:hypothetical protein
MKKVFAFIFLIMAAPAFAGDCDWAKETPPDGGGNKYFVARVYSEESASDAQYKAEREIDGQLCRLFGAEINTASEFYSDSGKSEGTTRSQERCVGVRLKSFMKEKSDVENLRRGEWVGCVKYKYSVKELNAEKARIEKAGFGGAAVGAFNESAGDKDCAGAPVKIITKPAGAEVFIGGRLRGETPLSLGNVCRGSKKLRILLENYMDVDEQIIVPLSNNTISKTLTRAKREIIIATNIGGANIKIDGVDHGREPVRFKATLGLPHEIEANSKEVFPVKKTIIIGKESNNEISLTLEKRPAKIDFTGWKQQNKDWKVEVGGREVEKSRELEPDKTYDLRFTNPKYRRVADTVRLKGGETLNYDKKYNFILLTSDAIGDDLELALFSGLGLGLYSLQLDKENNKAFGLQLDALAIRLRKDSFYARLGAGYAIGKFDMKYTGVEIGAGFNADMNLGFNFGAEFSAFGIMGGELLAVKRPPASDGRDLSGNQFYTFYGAGLEYNPPRTPVSLRLTYTTGAADLWDDFRIGRTSVQVNKIMLRVGVNWGKVVKIIDDAIPATPAKKGKKK